MQLRAFSRVLPFLAVGFLGIAPLSSYGESMKDEPDGFGKAKFGMSEQQVKALYPEIQEMVMPTPPPEQAPKEPPPFALTTYNLDNQSFGPLKQCKVRMRFFEHKLTDLMYDCANKDQVHDYLESRFGVPTSISARRAITWFGNKTTVTEMGATQIFMISDLELGKRMSYTLLGYAMKVQGRIPGIGDAPQTPAPTPPAGS